MENLNELVVRAKAACDGRAVGYMEKVNPHTILAIAEAFRALEQRVKLTSAVFESALALLNDVLDDCGDSERGLLLALSRMGIEVEGE